MKFKFLVVLLSSLMVFACSSGPKDMSDGSGDSAEMNSEPEVNDFNEEGLFDAEGGSEEPASADNYDPELNEESAAVDTGEDEKTAGEPEENPFPAPEAEQPKTKPVAKKPSKAMNKSATRRTRSDCNMRAKPSSSSNKLTMVPKGRKIWTEPEGDEWFKVYRKKGVGYLSKVCF